MPKFYMIFAWKIFPEFFWGGGGANAPPAAQPSPASYTYAVGAVGGQLRHDMMQGPPKAPLAMHNASQKSSGDKNKEVRGYKVYLFVLRENRK